MSATVAGIGPGGAVLNVRDNTFFDPEPKHEGVTIGAPNQPGTVNMDNSMADFASANGAAAVEIGAANGPGIFNIASCQFSAEGNIDVGMNGPGTLNISSGICLVSGNLVVGDQGTLLESGQDGDLQLKGSLNLSSGATFGFEIDEQDSATINLDGTSVFVNGIFTVTLGDGFEPTAGDSFAPFSNFNTESGTFAAINLPPLNPGLAWDTSHLYTTGAISVIAVPEPTSVGLLMAGAVGLLLARRARTHQTTNNIH